MQKVKEKVTAVTCQRKMITAILKLLLKVCLKLKETNTKAKIEIAQLTEGNSSPEQELTMRKIICELLKMREMHYSLNSAICVRIIFISDAKETWLPATMVLVPCDVTFTLDIPLEFGQRFLC